MTLAELFGSCFFRTACVAPSLPLSRSWAARVRFDGPIPMPANPYAWAYDDRYVRFSWNTERDVQIDTRHFAHAYCDGREVGAVYVRTDRETGRRWLTDDHGLPVSDC